MLRLRTVLLDGLLVGVALYWIWRGKGSRRKRKTLLRRVAKRNHNCRDAGGESQGCTGSGCDGCGYL